MTDTAPLSNLRSLRDTHRVSTRIWLKPVHKHTLETVRESLCSVLGVAPANSLLFRRALEVYSRYLASLDADDAWKREAARVKALR